MSENVQVPDAIRQRLDDLSMHFCAVRAERGASLRTVAAQTGASPVALGRFEAGRNPSLGLLVAVLAWLELPMAWLDADAGAPQDGHSATETTAQGAEAREDANSSSITAQDLSEPEPCSQCGGPRTVTRTEYVTAPATHDAMRRALLAHYTRRPGYAGPDIAKEAGR